MARLSGPTSSCPECGAAFAMRKWSPVRDEGLSVLIARDGMADLVDGRMMMVRCRDGHLWRVGRWHKSTHKGDRYELEPW